MAFFKQWLKQELDPDPYKKLADHVPLVIIVIKITKKAKGGRK
jgi:hypothetical protein